LFIASIGAVYNAYSHHVLLERIKSTGSDFKMCSQGISKHAICFYASILNGMPMRLRRLVGSNAAERKSLYCRLTNLGDKGILRSEEVI